MVLVLSSARLAFFCLVLLACVGSAFSLKCHKCDDPCDKPESVECSGFCLNVTDNGKLEKKECVSVQLAQAEGVTTTGTVTDCKKVNARSRCFCNDKDDCNSDVMSSSSKSNNSSTKPTLWTSILCLGLACFYIRFKGM